MDDIYDNLENYDDLNKIDELKKENQQLKCQIEEYTTAIDQLQKDFDKLAAEHKKLELNYSSLLKTAKAEIERKTQMIKDLNIEKDKLVLNLRQNRGKNALDIFKSGMHKSKKEKKIGGQEQLEGTHPHTKTHIQQCESNSIKENNQLTDSGTNCDIREQVINEGGKYPGNKNRNKEIENYMSKENDMQVLNKVQNRPHTETKLKRISNRRKSMPVLNPDVKYSSDEEYENNGSAAENKIHSQRTDDKRFEEKTYYSNKLSETSSVENNYLRNYHDPPPNTYSKNRSSWHYDNDKYRSRDKFESSQIRRWHLSPDRSFQRWGKDYTENYHNKYDFNKRRAYESPPRDKYYRSKSRDRRSNYERDYTQNLTKHWSDHERYGEKHKLRDDVDEPKYKRQKLEPSHRHAEDDNRWQKDIDINRALVATPLEITENISCQSPDYVYIDNHTAPIKEIMNTAVTNLEDPRLTSKKYKAVNDSIEKAGLTTVIGRNVEIIPIDKTRWGLETVPMPKALLEPPSSFTEEVITNFSLTNDNPMSKEQVTLAENSGDDHVSTSADVQKLDSNKCTKKPQQNNKRDDSDKLKSIVTNTDINNIELSKKLLANKYKIPKLNSVVSKHREGIKKTPLDTNKSPSTEPVKLAKRLGADHDRATSSTTIENQPLEIEKCSKNNQNYEICHSVKLNSEENITVCDNDNPYRNKHKFPELLKKGLEHDISGENSNNKSEVDNIHNTRTTHKSEEECLEDNLVIKNKSMPQLNSFSKSSTLESDIENVDTENRKHVETAGENTSCLKYADLNLELSTKIVENDLVLSDETSEVMEPENKIVKKKTKIKTKNEVYNEKQRNKQEPKKCVSDKIQMEIDTVENKNTQPLEIKDEITSREIIGPGKRHKSKKQTQENTMSNVVQPQTTKPRKGKKEKENKPQEIKTKFSDLFGDSSSLITPDDLGIVTSSNELVGKYGTFFENTQDAVDINVKEFENIQTPKAVCDESQNMTAKTCPSIQNSGITSIVDSNCKDVQLKMNQPSLKTINEFKEITDVFNVYDGKSKTSEVKTIIISMGMQSQTSRDNDKDSTKLPNILSYENIERPNTNLDLKALATSTPAKVIKQDQDSTRIPASLSNNSTDSKIVESPWTVDQSTETNTSRKDVDVPDVRIFVKRRRKVKTMTP